MCSPVQNLGQAANKTLWALWEVDWITSHAAVQTSANTPVLLEEFGVTSIQCSIYQLWWNTVLSSGLTGKPPAYYVQRNTPLNLP